MKYIFIDVDGTLYSPTKNLVPQSAIDAMAHARALGNKIFICTGRSYAEALPYLSYDIDGYVLSSGGLVCVDDNILYNKPIPSQTVSELTSIVGGFGYGYTCEGVTGTYCSEKGYESALLYFSGGATEREKLIENVESNSYYLESRKPADETIYKMTCFTKTGEDITKLKQAMPYPYAASVCVKDQFGEDTVEITNSTIDKASGIKYILDYFNADWTKTVAIGDSANDIPMFDSCNISVAMGNASDEVKEYANYVAPDILDDGLAYALDNLDKIEL